MSIANDLAQVLGISIDDINTFKSASYQDSVGNKYAVTSLQAKSALIITADEPLVAPDHAPEADLTSAAQAQAMLVINQGAAVPDRIAVVLGDRLESSKDHLTTLGLSRIPDEA